MSDAKRVNGNLISWGSIKVKIDDEPYYGFTAIAFGDSRTREKGHGMGKHQRARGRTRGKYETDPVKLTGPKSSVQALREALAAKSSNTRSYGDVEFEIVVQYVEGEEPPQTVVIHRCVWVKSTTNEQEGPGVITEDIEIDCMSIERNSTTLYDSAE